MIGGAWIWNATWYVHITFKEFPQKRSLPQKCWTLSSFKFWDQREAFLTWCYKSSLQFLLSIFVTSYNFLISMWAEQLLSIISCDNFPSYWTDVMSKRGPARNRGQRVRAEPNLWRVSLFCCSQFIRRVGEVPCYTATCHSSTRGTSPYFYI